MNTFPAWLKNTGWVLVFLMFSVGGVQVTPTRAQEDDALNLPTDLYILSNTGVITRFGVGQAGVRTISPEDTFIIDFAVAPQADWMAYRTEDNITLTPLHPIEQQDFTLDEGEANAPPIRSMGKTMAWAPDSRVLAYTTLFGIRVAFDAGGSFTEYASIAVSPIQHLVWSPGGTYLAAEAEDNVWWVYRRDGTTMPLASAIPASNGIAWLSDTQLVFAPPEGGLIMMDLANANAQSALTDNTQIYFEPTLRPSGRIAAFVKNTTDTELDENRAFFQEMRVNQGLVSVLTTSETPTDFTNAFWGPSGRIMVSLRAGAPALIVPDAGVYFALPFADAVDYDWGAALPEAVPGLVMNNTASFLSPTVEGITQVWRLRGDGLPPAPITASLDDVTLYAISENGRNLVYVSEGRIWLQALNSGNNTATERLAVENPIVDIGFDAGGQMLSYVTTPTEENPEAGVWLLPIAEGDPQLAAPLELDDEGQPAFTYQAAVFAPNINAVLLRRQTGEAVDYYVLDPISNALSTVGPYNDAKWLSDGRIATTSTDITGSGIYTIVPNVFPVEAAIVLRAASTIADYQEVAPGVLRVILRGASRPGETGIRVADVRLESGEPDEIAMLDFMTLPSISPDGNFIAGFIESGSLLAIFDVETGQKVSIAGTNSASAFHWW